MLTLLVSASILFSLIFFTAKRFASYETFVEQAEKPIAKENIPFPAVTICPDSLVFEKFMELGNISSNFNDDE